MPQEDRFDSAIGGYPKKRLGPRENQFVRYDLEQTQWRHELRRKVQVWVFVWCIPIITIGYGILKWLSETVAIKP